MTPAPRAVAGRRPADVPALLAALQASDPGRPRLTWYGPDGERVELSARVLDNWVAKTANLLVEELDAGPGTSVHLALPPHWRTAVWALATWSAGGVLSDSPEADVVVTGDPRMLAGAAARTVAVALPALARSAGALPAGVLDYNAEVSGFGDVLVASEPAALPGDLPELPPAARVLVPAQRYDHGTDLLAALAADGSLVLCSPDVAADPSRLARIAETEQVTLRR